MAQGSRVSPPRVCMPVCTCDVCAWVSACTRCLCTCVYVCELLLRPLGLCRADWKGNARLGLGFQKPASTPALAMASFVLRLHHRHRLGQLKPAPGRGRAPGKEPEPERRCCVQCPCRPGVRPGSTLPSVHRSRSCQAGRRHPGGRRERGLLSAPAVIPWRSREVGALPTQPNTQLTFRPSDPNSPCAEGK